MPAETSRSSEPPAITDVVDGSSCAALMSAGVQHAQAGAARSGRAEPDRGLVVRRSAALRELAGLRLLQRRWPEVSELASAVLATGSDGRVRMAVARHQSFRAERSRWCARRRGTESSSRMSISSPSAVSRHTRQRVVERLLAVPAEGAAHARALRPECTTPEGPAIGSGHPARVRAASRGLAELRAHVVERPLVPTDPWSYAALGLVAVARNEVGLSTGALTGGGERFTAGWRFWPGQTARQSRGRGTRSMGRSVGRRRVRGTAAIFGRARFRRLAVPAAGVTLSNWISPWARVSARAGIDAWDDRGSYGVASGGLRLASARDRVIVGIDGSSWLGDDPFGSIAASLRLRSSDAASRASVHRAHRGRNGDCSDAP